MPQGNRLTKPLTDLPSRAARALTPYIDPMEGDRGYVRPFLAGAAEGAGDVLSDMTSPLSLGLTALGMPWLNKVKNISRIGKIVNPAEYMPMTHIAKGDEAIYNAARAAELLKEKQKIQAIADANRHLGSRVGSKDVTGNIEDEVVKFQQARQRARARAIEPE